MPRFDLLPMTRYILLVCKPTTKFGLSSAPSNRPNRFYFPSSLFFLSAFEKWLVLHSSGVYGVGHSIIGMADLQRGVQWCLKDSSPETRGNLSTLQLWQVPRTVPTLYGVVRSHVRASALSTESGLVLDGPKHPSTQAPPTNKSASTCLVHLTSTEAPYILLLLFLDSTCTL